jgi:hypothetical protein
MIRSLISAVATAMRPYALAAPAPCCSLDGSTIEILPDDSVLALMDELARRTTTGGMAAYKFGAATLALEAMAAARVTMEVSQDEALARLVDELLSVPFQTLLWFTSMPVLDAALKLRGDRYAAATAAPVWVTASA